MAYRACVRTILGPQYDPQGLYCSPAGYFVALRGCTTTRKGLHYSSQGVYHDPRGLAQNPCGRYAAQMLAKAKRESTHHNAQFHFMIHFVAKMVVFSEALEKVASCTMPLYDSFFGRSHSFYNSREKSHKVGHFHFMSYFLPKSQF